MLNQVIANFGDLTVRYTEVGKLPGLSEFSLLVDRLAHSPLLNTFSVIRKRDNLPNQV